MPSESSPDRTCAMLPRSTRTGASGGRTTRSARSTTRARRTSSPPRSLVKKGKVISLALNYDEKGPQGAKSNYPALGRINPCT